jgi:hypothetical protein
MARRPVTAQVKGYPFEVVVEGKQAGAILSDQVKGVDWRARRATRKGRVSNEVLAVVTWTYDPTARCHSDELLAQAFQLGAAAPKACSSKSKA